MRTDAWRGMRSVMVGTVLGGVCFSAFSQTSPAQPKPLPSKSATAPSLRIDPAWLMEDRMAMMEAEISMLRKQNELAQLRRALGGGSASADVNMPRVVSIGPAGPSEASGKRRELAALVRELSDDPVLVKVGDRIGHWRITQVEMNQVMAVAESGYAVTGVPTKLPMESITVVMEARRASGQTGGAMASELPPQNPSQPGSVAAAGVVPAGILQGVQASGMPLPAMTAPGQVGSFGAQAPAPSLPAPEGPRTP